MSIERICVLSSPETILQNVLDFDLNIFGDIDGNFVSQTAVPVALNKAMQEEPQQTKPLKDKESIPLPKKTEPKPPDNLVVNTQPKKRGRPKDNYILPDLPNRKRTKCTIKLSKCNCTKTTFTRVRKNILMEKVLKHREDDPTQLATQDIDDTKLSPDLIMLPDFCNSFSKKFSTLVQAYTENVVTKHTTLARSATKESNLDDPEVYRPQTSTEGSNLKTIEINRLQKVPVDPKLEIPDVNPLQTTTEVSYLGILEVKSLQTEPEEPKLEISEVKTLQRRPEEQKLEIPGINTLQIAPEEQKLEIPGINTLQIAPEESKFEIPQVNKLQEAPKEPKLEIHEVYTFQTEPEESKLKILEVNRLQGRPEEPKLEISGATTLQIAPEKPKMEIPVVKRLQTAPEEPRLEIHKVYTFQTASEEPNTEVPEVNTLQAEAKELKLEINEVYTLQTELEESKLQIPEVNKLQEAPKEPKLEIHEFYTLQTEPEESKLEILEVHRLQRRPEEPKLEIPGVTMLQTVSEKPKLEIQKVYTLQTASKEPNSEIPEVPKEPNSEIPEVPKEPKLEINEVYTLQTELGESKLEIPDVNKLQEAPKEPKLEIHEVYTLQTEPEESKLEILEVNRLERRPEEPKLEIPGVTKLHTVLEEAKLEIKKVYTRQTVSEEPKLEINEVYTLQTDFGESKLKIPDVKTLQTRNEDLKLRTPKDYVLLIPIEKFISKLSEANTLETPTKDSNSNNMPQETKSMRCKSEKAHSSLDDLKVTNLVNSILSKHAEEVETKRLGIKFPNKISRPMNTSNKPVSDTHAAENPNLIQKAVKTYCRIKDVSTLVSPVPENLNLLVKPKRTYCRIKKVTDTVTSETENLNSVRKPTKTYSRNKKVSEPMVDLKIAQALPENKLTITNIDGTKNYPITMDEENSISTVKLIQTYSSNNPSGIPRPTAIESLNKLQYEPELIVPTQHSFEKPENTENWNMDMDSDAVLIPELVPLNMIKPEKEDEILIDSLKVEPEVELPQSILKVEIENEAVQQVQEKNLIIKIEKDFHEHQQNVVLMTKPNEWYSNITKLPITSTSQFPVNKTSLRMPIVVLERLKFPINTKTSRMKTNSTVVQTNSRLSTFEIDSKLLSSSKRTNGPLSRQRNLMTAPDKNLASLLLTDKVPIVRLHRYIPPKKGIKDESFKKSRIDIATKSSEQGNKFLETSITVDAGCKKLNNPQDVIKLCTTLLPKSRKSSSTKINIKKKILVDRPKQTKNIKKPKIKNGQKEPTLKKVTKKMNIQSLVEIVADKIMPKFDDQMSYKSRSDQDTLPTSFKPSVSFTDSSFDDQSESMASVHYTSSVSMDQVKPSTSDTDSLICEAMVRELISKVLLEETISEVVMNASFSEEALISSPISEPIFDPAVSDTVLDLIKDVSTFSESGESFKRTFKTVDPVFEPEVFHQILQTVKKAKFKPIKTFEICRQKSKLKHELRHHKKSEQNVGSLVLDLFQCPDCELGFSRKYDYEKHRYSAHNVKKFTCKLCGNQFLSLLLLRGHEKRHEENRLYKFKCIFCSREFKDLTCRNRHMYCHTTSRPFKCDLCSKSFISNTLLVRHRMVHDDKKEIQCRRCKIVFEDYQKFMRHLNDIHRSQEQHNCEICSLSFSSKAILTRHKVLNHFDKTKLHSCDICKTPFSTLKLLQFHRTIHNKKHRCVTCGKSFNIPCRLKNHIAEWHSNHRPFKCDLCHKAFSNQLFLNRHKRLHEGGRKKVKIACPICKREVVDLESHTRSCNPDKKQVDLKGLALKFPCIVCKGVYETELELTEHICSNKLKRKTMVSQFLCLICKRTYRTERLREEHCAKSHLPLTKSNSTLAMKFTCCTCDKRFDTEDAKNEHRKTHFNPDGTIIKPYSCQLCDKKLASKKWLTKHMSVHDESKRFPCPICFKLFRLQAYVKTHMTIHTGEKNYECKHCGRKFAHRNAKNKHEMIHTGERPYSCNICGKTFNRKAAVALHMLSHTKEIPHECMFCGAKYRYYSKFRTHLKKHIKPVEEIMLGN